MGDEQAVMVGWWRGREIDIHPSSDQQAAPDASAPGSQPVTKPNPRDGGAPCPFRHRDRYMTGDAMSMAPTLPCSAGSYRSPRARSPGRCLPGCTSQARSSAGTSIHSDVREVVNSVWTTLTHLERAGQHPGTLAALRFVQSSHVHIPRCDLRKCDLDRSLIVVAALHRVPVQG